MSALADAIKKVATGPHLSKDLSSDEAHDAMAEILTGEADPVRAAIFLIALRMKRETDDENWGLLSAIREVSNHAVAEVDSLLDLQDPYNGYSRHCPIAAFLPAVLVACGLPTVSQGVVEMAPKFGVTHAQVLTEAGIAVDLTVSQAASQISDPNIAWAYLDQAQAAPALFGLKELRTQIIKRPSLSSLEKLVKPISAQGNTHLMLGFVHKAYPPMLADLAKRAGYNSAFLARGLEGGVIPTLRETAQCYQWSNDSGLVKKICDPIDANIAQTTRGLKPQVKQVTAAETATLGLAALSGQQGVAYDSLVYGAALALWYCNMADSLTAASARVRTALDSGKAQEYFNAAKG